MNAGLPNSKRDSAATGAKPVPTVASNATLDLGDGEVLRSQHRVPKKSRGLAPPVNKAPTATLPKPKSPTQPGGWHIQLNRPSWLMSLVVHAALLLGLSYCTLSTMQREELALWASDMPQEEILDEFPELTIDPSVELASVDTKLPTQLEDPGVTSLGNLSGEAEFAEISTFGSLASSAAGEFGALFSDGGSGLSDAGAGSGGATTSFFGTKSEARRVIFVIDNTGSMSHGGFEAVVVELIKTVDAMDPRQQFYVFFYSDQVYPLYFPQSQATYVRANKDHKQLLRSWLDSVEMCTGGVWQLTQAMDAAFAMKPDVVYLLSDGRDWDRVRAKYKVEAVNRLKSQPNPLGIPIHTLGMGCKVDIDRENLESVARANSGIFREVEVSPAMTKLAYKRDRPYHATEPGPVWGSKVLNREALGDDDKHGHEK